MGKSTAWRILGATLAAPFLGFGLLPSAGAMQLSRAGDALVLSGEIVYQDLERVTKALDTSPHVRVVVLRNSMGGNSWTGYRLGELFRARGLTTVVSGHCVSSCSRLFLGGKKRLFSDDFPSSLTYVGFHGHYDFDQLNPASVKKNDLVAWTMRYAGDRLDRTLVERWAAIPKRAGDVRFYPAEARTSLGAITFYCTGDEARRPAKCERISTNAEAQGIVTSDRIYRSADRERTFYGERERMWPTTKYAPLAEPPRGATSSVARDYRAFLAASVPRAFALSDDQRVAAWRGNNRRAIEEALAACEQRAKRRCALYAVDERVVFSPR